MYSVVLLIHSLLRWAVVLLAFVAAGRGLIGWFAGRAWTRMDDKVGLALVASFDLQFLLGLVLYAVLSPLTQGAFRDFGAAMQNRVVRFWAVEHVALGILALLAVHLGRILTRRAGDDRAKHQRAAMAFAFATLLILAMIPWPFLPQGRPLLRFG